MRQKIEEEPMNQDQDVRQMQRSKKKLMQQPNGNGIGDTFRVHIDVVTDVIPVWLLHLDHAFFLECLIVLSS